MTNSAMRATSPNRARWPSWFATGHWPAAICVLLCLSLQSYAAHGAILGPYQAEADTLHLWHMNEQGVPVFDAGTDGTHLMALKNGATLGNLSFKGFGTALSTYDGGPDAVSDAGRDAYLSALPLQNGRGDNIAMSYAGPSDAFTYEAVIRVDFEPQTNFGTNANGNGRGTVMQIINLDADEATNRVCQFCLVPVGLLRENRQPLLAFINLNKEKSIQSLTAPIPADGPDAIRLGNWYHVAVTYDGTPNRPSNLKFYWTLMDPDRTAANLIGTGQMTQSLAVGCQPDFTIGQTGRQGRDVPYPNNNFVGLIDEVRFSGTARSSTQMMFGPSTIVAATPAASGASGSKTSSNRWSGATWLIAGALVVITGLLGWLVFVLKRLVSAGNQNRQSARLAPQAPVAIQAVPAYAIEVAPPDSTSFLKRTEHAAPSNSAAGTGFLKRVEPEVQAHPVNPSFMKRTGEAGHRWPALQAPGAAAESRPYEAPGMAPEVPAQPSRRADERMPAEGDPGLAKIASDGKTEGGFRGVLRKVGLQDLIQLECLNRKSSILEIANEEIRGWIYIEHGEIIHAVAGEHSAEEALNMLFSLHGGEFSLKAFEHPEERTIRGSWIQLLMEAARTRDEIDEDEEEGAEEKATSPGTSTSGVDDIMAMATLLTELPQVKQLILCSSEGKPLHTFNCSDSVGRAALCFKLSRTAKTISELMRAGGFESLEILNDESRTVMHTEYDCNLLVEMTANAANPLSYERNRSELAR